MLREYQVTLDHVFFLDVDQDIAKERILGRLLHQPSGRVYHEKFKQPEVQWKDDVTGEQLIKRDDDTERAFEKRLGSFQARKEEISKFFSDLGVLHVVDANKPADEVYEEIVGILNDSEERKKVADRRKRLSLRMKLPTKEVLPDPHLNQIAMKVSAYMEASMVQLMKNLALSKKYTFAGTLHTTLHKKNKAPLHKKDYMAAILVEGTRYFLLFHAGRAFFIDRKADVAYSPLIHFPKEMNNTVLDGLLTKRNDNDNLAFVVYDAMYHREASLIEVPFLKRLNAVRESVKLLNKAKIVIKEDEVNAEALFSMMTSPRARYMDKDKMDGKNENGNEEENKENGEKKRFIEFVIQDFHPEKKLKQIWEKRKESPFTPEGVMLMPKDYGYYIGLSKNAFIWRPFVKDEINFLINKVLDDSGMPRFEVQVFDWDKEASEGKYLHFDWLSGDIDELEDYVGKVVKCKWENDKITKVPNSGASWGSGTKNRKGGWTYEGHNFF